MCLEDDQIAGREDLLCEVKILNISSANHFSNGLKRTGAMAEKEVHLF